MKSRRKGRETWKEEQELRAEGVRGAAGGAGRERPGSQKGGQLRAAAVRLVGRQCRADLVVRASTSPLLHLPAPPLRLLLLRPSHPLHPQLTVPRARASGQGQGPHDPLRPQVPAAAHGRTRVTSLVVDADGAPRPGYVTLLSSRVTCGLLREVLWSRARDCAHGAASVQVGGVVRLAAARCPGVGGGAMVNIVPQSGTLGRGSRLAACSGVPVLIGAGRSRGDLNSALWHVGDAAPPFPTQPRPFSVRVLGGAAHRL